jgi:hypothetical protein
VISLESFVSMPKALPVEGVESAIHVIRGMRVMLDADLAGFYGVKTHRLNEQFRRNRGRFPEDFAFQLTAEEVAGLRSQNAISKIGRGGRRFLPWVFTEHGTVMLASVLNSKAAVNASVAIVRAFIRMREALQISGGDLIAKLARIDGRLDGHDETLAQVVAALNALLSAPTKPSKEMGFHTLREDILGAVIPGMRKSVRHPLKRPARNGRRKDSLS